MRRLSCLIALLACLVLALPAFAAPQKADAISGISSEKVLDIVKANKGKLVFINFFATWCPPCREEIPGTYQYTQSLSCRQGGHRRYFA